MGSTPPPSEPDVRISRIRLSSRWFVLREDWQTGHGRLASEKPRLDNGGGKPALIFRPIALPSLTPLIEGCQQPRCPHPRFGAELRGAPDRPLRRMVALAGSAITSPCGHYRRFLPLVRHHVSTFLHPFAPPALPGFNATMSAVTPAGGCGLKASVPSCNPCRSPCFTQSAFRALRLQPPTRSHGRFST